jgi:hypothetical protein
MAKEPFVTDRSWWELKRALKSNDITLGQALDDDAADQHLASELVALHLLGSCDDLNECCRATSTICQDAGVPETAPVSHLTRSMSGELAMAASEWLRVHSPVPVAA